MRNYGESLKLYGQGGNVHLEVNGIRWRHDWRGKVKRHRGGYSDSPVLMVNTGLKKKKSSSSISVIVKCAKTLRQRINAL